MKRERTKNSIKDLLTFLSLALVIGVSACSGGSGSDAGDVSDGTNVALEQAGVILEAVDQADPQGANPADININALPEEAPQAFGAQGFGVAEVEEKPVEQLPPPEVDEVDSGLRGEEEEFAFHAVRNIKLAFRVNGLEGGRAFVTVAYDPDFQNIVFRGMTDSKGAITETFTHNTGYDELYIKAIAPGYEEGVVEFDLGTDLVVQDTMTLYAI